MHVLFFSNFQQFKEHYLELYSAGGAPPAAVKKVNKKLAQLLAVDLTDEDMDVSSTSAMPSPDSDNNKPWLCEFKLYIDGVDEVPNGMTITKWWGVSLFINI